MTVPVTVVGGFLGAGKTTLVNHVLRVATRRYAVLVNDFGALDVDAALVRAQEGDVLALSNGCVCCGAGPDLGAGIERLARLDPPPDWMLVEASGVSDPRRIGQLVQLEAGVTLDSVVVLVDAAAFSEQLADPYLEDTLIRQVARADLVVLNKCDLADEATRAALAAKLRALAPTARLATVRGGAFPEALVGLSIGPNGAGPEGVSRLAADAPDHPFRTCCWRDERPFDEARLRALLADMPRAVLRIKGVCLLGEAADPHLLQLAGGRWSLRPYGAGPPKPGLVLIGTAEMPDEPALGALFAKALLSDR